MAKRKPKKPYSALTVPTPRYDGDNRRWKEEVVIPRLRALMDHYGIDQNGEIKWYQLAVRLAFDHVPGLEPPLPQGRKAAEQTIIRDHALFHAVAKAELEKKSISNAIRQLTIKNPQFKGMNPRTLRHRYYLLKDDRSKEAKRMNAYDDWLVDMWIENQKWDESRL